jgi:hypothetical protein
MRGGSRVVLYDHVLWDLQYVGFGVDVGLGSSTFDQFADLIVDLLFSPESISVFLLMLLLFELLLFGYLFLYWSQWFLLEIWPEHKLIDVALLLMGFESRLELLFRVQSFLTVASVGILLLAGLLICEYDLVDVPFGYYLVDLPWGYQLVKIAAFWFYLYQGRLRKGVHAAWLSLV